MRLARWSHRRREWLPVYLAASVVIVLLCGSTVWAGAGQRQLSLWPGSSIPAAAAGAAKRVPVLRLLDDAPQRLFESAKSADSALRCDGYWQGEAAQRSIGWVLGIEVYASYQDPAELLCENTYPFTVTEVYWIVVVDWGQWIKMQPVIASNVGTTECPLPGSVLCLGPLDSMFFEPGIWMVQLTFDTACVVNGPYFACVYLPEEVEAGTVDLAFDGSVVPSVPCRSYNDWGDGWQDLSSAFSNMILWSEGLSAGDGCACDCHADPRCDGVIDVLDIVETVNVAFRNGAILTDPNTLCPSPKTDVNCDLVTNVFDVVSIVNVAFRSGDPVAEFCAPCP